MGDSGYGGRSRGRSQNGNTFMDKENYSPSKKARKSLASNWAPSGQHATGHIVSGAPAGLHMRLGHENVHDNSLTAPETPSKSLVGTNDASMLFSPPAILKDTVLPDDSGAGFSSDSLTPHDSNYYSDQSGSLSHSHGGGRSLAGNVGRNRGISDPGNGSVNCSSKKGAGLSPAKSKASTFNAH